MDTMNITKIVGGLCGALLVYLLINWVAESLYHTGGGHGEGEHTAGYVIEVEETETKDPSGDEPTMEELMALAEIEKGAKIFAKCKACHKIEDGANSVGPHLFGVLDRAIASVDGFGYSGALTGLGGNWGIEELNKFLQKPSDYAPGTKMSFAGLKKPMDRANLIMYLSTIK